MLTKDELLTQKEKPNIRDISLRLYKEFSEEVLLKQKFVYYFVDGTNIQIEFREWGIYHMLSIQHINGRIDRNKFFQAIDEGLELSSFQENNAINNRFRNQKERITMFSCIYSALKEASAFYIPSGRVKNTNSVKSDYIIFLEVGTKGMNVGLMKVGKVYVPITILISKPSNKEIYLEDAVHKDVEKLEIINMPVDNNEEIIETSTEEIIEILTEDTEEIELDESFQEQ